MLKVWLPLNKDLRNNGASGCIVTNNGATISGGCATFNGSSNYIACSNQNIDGKKISASCWVYMNTLSNTNYLISLNGSGGYSDQEIGLCVESGYIYFCANGLYVTSSNIQTNTWTHLTVTFDGSKITGYVNGVSIGSVNHTTILNRTNLTIGARHNGNSTYIYYGNCKLRDIRIYDHCLSHKEVCELSKGLIAHYKLDGKVDAKPDLFVDAVLHTPFKQTQSITDVNSGILPSTNTGTITANGYYTDGESCTQCLEYTDSRLLSAFDDDFTFYFELTPYNLDRNQYIFHIQTDWYFIGLYIYYTVNNRFGITLSNGTWGSDYDQEIPNSPIVDYGRKYKICFKGGRNSYLYVFINGVKYTIPRSYSSHATLTKFMIGRNWNDSRYSKTDFADFAVWNKKLTDDDCINLTMGSEAYTECTNGTSYLNIPYSNKDFRYRLKFSFVKNNTSARYNNNVMDIQGGSIMVYSYSSSDVFYNKVKPVYWSSGTMAQHVSPSLLPTVEYGRVYDMELRYINDTVSGYMDGNLIYSYTDTNYLTNRGVYFFNDIVHTNGSYAKIYNAQVYSGASDSTLVYNFIPYEDPNNNNGGFKDTISNNTWTTSGLALGYEQPDGEPVDEPELITGEICDYSGMGNHGTIGGDLYAVDETRKYLKSTKFTTFNDYIELPASITPSLTGCSISFWILIEGMGSAGWLPFAGQNTSYYLMATSNGTGAFYHSNIGSLTKTIYRDGVVATAPLNDGKWHHYVMTGIDLHTWTKLYLNQYGAPTYITQWDFKGKVSDLRIYNTILSADAVLSLYRDSLSVDKSQGSSCWEYVENNLMPVTEPVKVKKNGIVECKKLSEEIVSFYDTNTYIEPDNSVWIHLFHHNAPSINGLFSSGDTFTTKVYKDEHRWFDMSVCNYVNKWELMIKVRNLATDPEVKYRWIQNVNPIIAAFNQTKDSQVTKITSDGYTALNYGGIMLRNGNTYLCMNNGIDGNWAGAIGAWTNWGAGIPGFGAGNLNDGYVDVYLRIDNLDDTTLARLGKEGFIANTLTEI